MNKIRIAGIMIIMLCMVASVCFAGDKTSWFTDDVTSIGQGAQGFASVQTALAGDLTGFSGTTVESAMQLLSGGASIPGLGGTGASGNLVGSFGVQTALSGVSAEPSLVGTTYNPIQRTEGTTEESRNALWALIKPFYEKGVAAMTPQQPLNEFISDVKAGKLSQAEAQNYMTQLQTNIDAFKAAFEAALNEYMAPYLDQGLLGA